MCNSLIYACVIKLTFPFTLYHVLKASGLLGVDCLFYTFHQGGIYTHTRTHTRLCVFIRVHPCVYVYTHMRVYINIGGSTSLCRRALCIVSVCFTSLVTTFCLVFFKWSCLCSTKDCNSFLEQGSYSVCVAHGYTVGVEWGYHKTKKNVFKNGWGLV